MAVDLSTVPTADLYAELQRRGWKPGRKAKLTTCPKCGAAVTARALRRRCPHLERWNATGTLKNTPSVPS